MELETRWAEPVHWAKNEQKWRPGYAPGTRLPVQNIPVPVIYPKESLLGLWGGEGIVKGYVKKKAFGGKIPKIWLPFLQKRVLYSEILDKHMAVTVTMRTLSLIDDAYGFDNYILKTHEGDLKSHLGMKLKREMLLALSRKTLYPANAVKCEEVFNKYKHFLEEYKTEEEIEWLGLSETEAIAKQLAIDENEKLLRKPLKEVLKAGMIEQLKSGAIPPAEPTTITSRVKKWLGSS